MKELNVGRHDFARHYSDPGRLNVIELNGINGIKLLPLRWSLVLPFLSGDFNFFFRSVREPKGSFQYMSSFCLHFLETVSDACNQKNVAITGSVLGLALQRNIPYLPHKEINSSLKHCNKYISLKVYTRPVVTLKYLSPAWLSPHLPGSIQLPNWYLHLNV